MNVMLKSKFPWRFLHRKYSVQFPDIDLEYYCNDKNISEIDTNIALRKNRGNIHDIKKLYNIYINTNETDKSYSEIKLNLFSALSKLPNKTHPDIIQYSDQPCVVKEINKKRDFGNWIPLTFDQITERMNLIRLSLRPMCGSKSYCFQEELAELEEALIKYTVDALLHNNFNLVSVPDILPSDVIESCGMTVNSDRTQIYSLDAKYHGPDLFLSGTAEMSLAGLLTNSVHNQNDLPLKLAAVSRCFRAEASTAFDERGIYRVHQFTKVEMFVIATPDQSEDVLKYLKTIQENLFTPLGLHMRVMDMPPHDLGAPAYRKYDIEAWMPGRGGYGEISSCSNCTDYQSRRLNIKYYHGKENSLTYVHTLNGTACAIPRMLIALLETHSNPKGFIHIPNVLTPFMSGKTALKKSTLPTSKLIKQKTK